MLRDKQTLTQTKAQNSASLTVLATKLFTPAPPVPYIERAHLTGELDDAIASYHPLTWVHAPAGFGKTSLLSGWASALPERGGIDTNVTWLSADENDNDPVRFWSYVIMALRAMLPGIGETALAVLQSPHPQSINAVVSTLINDLAYAVRAQRGNAYVLIIDDFHVVRTSAIHDSLAFFVKHLNPLPVYLIISSRTEPELHISRMRARGQLTYISANALRFSVQETRCFLEKAVPQKLTEAQMLDLYERTEGWPAGLQLASLAIRPHCYQDENRTPFPHPSSDPISQFINAFSGNNQYVLEYLGDEILRQQTPEMRQFLFYTAALEQFNAELCDVIRESEDSQQYLDSLVKQNLFLVPLNQQHTWFRYHRMFGEFLRSRQHQAQFSASLDELHLRASQWYANAGRLPDAIHHAFKASDHLLAALLIADYARPALVNGESRLLLSWLDQLPKSIIRAHPKLALAKAWSMIVGGEPAHIRPLLASIPTPDGTHTDAIYGEKAAITSLIATLMGDTETAIQNANLALDILPENDLFMRALIGINLGRAYDMVGDLHRSGRIYQEALDAATQTDNTLVAIMALCQLGDIDVVRGNLHAAAVKYHRAIRLAEQTGRFLPVVGLAYAAMGNLHYRWGEFRQAETHLDAAIDLGRTWESTDILIISSIYAAQVKLAERQHQQAIAFILQAEQALQGNIVSTPTVAAAKALITRLYMRLGKTHAGTQWLNTNSLQRENIAHDLYHLQAITRAQVLLAFDEPATVCAELSQGLNALEFEGYFGYVLERSIMLAVAEETRGHHRAAMVHIQSALELGAGDGDVYSFVEAGPTMRALLESARMQGIQVGYAAQILRHFDDASARAIITTPAPDFESLPILVEELSPRETEVLQLLAKGKANKEIASSLYIAPGTVKQHLKSIYGKLDVHNRTEAANRGRAMQLI